MKFGFWTCHDLIGEAFAADAAGTPPGEAQLSALKPGMMFIPGTSECYVLVLREVFDTFEEGKAWMDNVFHETDWDEYLFAWKATVAAAEVADAH